MTEYYWMGFYFTFGAGAAFGVIILSFGIIDASLKAWKNRKK
jgi:hypothetical protein